jgi:hypothetical protein
LGWSRHGGLDAVRLNGTGAVNYKHIPFLKWSYALGKWLFFSNAPQYIDVSLDFLPFVKSYSTMRSAHKHLHGKMHQSRTPGTVNLGKAS